MQGYGVSACFLSERCYSLYGRKHPQQLPAHLMLTSWSPLPLPRGSAMPLPRMRSTSPFNVICGTVNSTLPSMVGTCSRLQQQQQRCSGKTQ
jgi:hypothetical protein